MEEASDDVNITFDKERETGDTSSENAEGSASDDFSSSDMDWSDLESNDEEEEPGPSQCNGNKRSRIDIEATDNHVQGEADPTQPSGNENCWHDTSEEDSAALPPPSFNLQRQPGFQGSLIKGRSISPLDIFLMFFSIGMVAELCNRSVAFLKLRQEKGEVGKRYKFPANFGPVTMLHVIGLLIYAGYVRFPKLSEYFRKDRFKLPLLAEGPLTQQSMTRILGGLHFSTTEEDAENHRKRLEGEVYDQIHRVRWLVEKMKEASYRHFAAGQQLCIYKRTVSKRKHGLFGPYFSAKEVRQGFKLFILACPRTGYIHNFDVYVGKKDLKKTQLSHLVVQNLLEDRFLNRGHIIYIDSSYSNQALFEHLAKQGTRCVGTVRPNRQGYPKNLLNSLDSRAQKGEIRWFRKGEVVYIQWKGPQLVNVASTCHKGHDVGTINVACGGNDAKNADIRIPKAILDCDKNIGVVDPSDHLVHSFEMSRVTKEWHKKFFFHCVDIAVTNSYVIYNDLQKREGKAAVSQYEFRLRLTEQLWDLRADSLPPAICNMWLMEHRLIKSGTLGPCVQCSTDTRQVQTQFVCTNCNVHLCFRFRNCSELYHRGSFGILQNRPVNH